MLSLSSNIHETTGNGQTKSTWLHAIQSRGAIGTDGAEMRLPDQVVSAEFSDEPDEECECDEADIEQVADGFELFIGADDVAELRILGYRESEAEQPVTLRGLFDGRH